MPAIPSNIAADTSTQTRKNSTQFFTSPNSSLFSFPLSPLKNPIIHRIRQRIGAGLWHHHSSWLHHVTPPGVLGFCRLDTQKVSLALQGYRELDELDKSHPEHIIFNKRSITCVEAIYIPKLPASQNCVAFVSKGKYQ